MVDILISEEMIQAIAEAEADICRRVSNCDSYQATSALATSYKINLDQLFLLFGPEKLSQAKILEIGSGNGFLLCHLIKNGCDIIGIEPGNSYGFLERYQRAARLLRENGISNPENYLYDATAESLPFADNTFDLVFSNVVLEHVQNLDLAMQESIRVLKPGGILWATAPNYNSWYEGHYKIPWIPYMGRNLAKVYVSRIFKRDPSFIDNLNFINPSMFNKYLHSPLTSGRLYLCGEGMTGSILIIANWCQDDKLIPTSNNYDGLKKYLISLLQNKYLRYLLRLPLFILSKFLQLIGLATMIGVIIRKK